MTITEKGNLMKYIAFLMMVAILVSLGSALFYLVKDQGFSTRTVKALTWRVGISITLFILLWVAFYMGWITPHSL